MIFRSLTQPVSWLECKRESILRLSPLHVCHGLGLSPWKKSNSSSAGHEDGLGGAVAVIFVSLGGSSKKVRIVRETRTLLTVNTGDPTGPLFLMSSLSPPQVGLYHVRRDRFVAQ